MAQLVEHDLAKVGVAGSNPVSRSYTKDKGGFPVMEVRFFLYKRHKKKNNPIIAMLFK